MHLRQSIGAGDDELVSLARPYGTKHSNVVSGKSHAITHVRSACYAAVR